MRDLGHDGFTLLDFQRLVNQDTVAMMATMTTEMNIGIVQDANSEDDNSTSTSTSSITTSTSGGTTSSSTQQQYRHLLLNLKEILSLRLYTGPGYQPINTFLREVAKLGPVGTREREGE